MNLRRVGVGVSEPGVGGPVRAGATRGSRSSDRGGE